MLRADVDVETLATFHGVRLDGLCGQRSNRTNAIRTDRLHLLRPSRSGVCEEPASRSVRSRCQAYGRFPVQSSEEVDRRGTPGCFRRLGIRFATGVLLCYGRESRPDANA